MTGNRLHKGYKNALEKLFDLLTCFEEYPIVHEKFKKLWTNVAMTNVFRVTFRKRNRRRCS